MSELDKILALAEFDRGMSIIEKELQHIPERLTAIETELEQLATPLNRAKNRFAELNQFTETTQLKLDEAAQTITEREAKLYMTKTQKEYQAVSAEISETKRLNKDLEGQVLQAMAEMETLETEIGELKPKVEGHITQLEDECEELKARKIELEKDLETELKKREQFLEGIDAKQMRRYEAARRINLDSVAFIDRGACEACYIRIPPQLVIEVRRREELHSCPSCQRILLYPTEENSEQAQG